MARGIRPSDSQALVETTKGTLDKSEEECTRVAQELSVAQEQKEQLQEAAQREAASIKRLHEEVKQVARAPPPGMRLRGERGAGSGFQSGCRLLAVGKAAVGQMLAVTQRLERSWQQTKAVGTVLAGTLKGAPAPLSCLHRHAGPQHEEGCT